MQALCWLSRELRGSESWLAPAAALGHRFQFAGTERVANVCVCVVCVRVHVFTSGNKCFRKRPFLDQLASDSQSLGFCGPRKS